MPCNENLQRRAEEVEEVTCKDLAVEEKHTTYTEMAGAASLSKKDDSIERLHLHLPKSKRTQYNSRHLRQVAVGGRQERKTRTKRKNCHKLQVHEY